MRGCVGVFAVFKSLASTHSPDMASTPVMSVVGKAAVFGKAGMLFLAIYI